MPTKSVGCEMRSPVVDLSKAVIVDKFRAPSCERCAGNRGVEFSLESGSAIFSATDGIVSFSGEVDRVEYLVITTRDNRRITYGRILTSLVRTGDVVVVGQQIATSSALLYFGVREIYGGVVIYVDPMRYLSSRLNTGRAGRQFVLVSDSNSEYLPKARC